MLTQAYLNFIKTRKLQAKSKGGAFALQRRARCACRYCRRKAMKGAHSYLN